MSAVSSLAIVEALEPHLLLSTVTWVNSSGGDWNTGSNWSTGNVPGSGDTAVISGLSSGAYVAYSSATSTVASIEASSPLQINSGSLTVTTSVAVTGTTLTLNSGTLAFSGDASMDATSGGQIDLGGGELTADGVLSASGLDSEGGTIDGTGSLSLSGTSNTWSGGTEEVPLAVESGAQLNVTGGDVSLVGGGSSPALDNSGTVELTGDIFLYSSGVIANESGGVFAMEDYGGGIVAGDSTSLAFNNYGQLQDVGDSDAGIAVPLDNKSTGTVEVTDSGTLQLGDGGSNANSSTTAFTANDSTVEFSGGTFTFTGNATVSATYGGQIELNGGELSLGGTLSVNGLDFGSGTIDSSGTVSLSGTDTWDGGTEAASLNVTSGSVLDITGDVSLGDDDAADVTLDNSGTINLSGNLTLYNSAIVDNESGGVFNIEGSSSGVGSYDSSGAALDNYGLLEDTGDTDATFWLPLINESTGTVDVTDSGTLQIDSGGSNANSSTTAFTADGGTIDFALGTFTFSGDATISSVGDGQIGVNGGELTVNGTLDASGLDFTSGSIDGTGSIALSGTENSWSGGTLSTSMTIGTDDSIDMTAGLVSISTTITDLGAINIYTSGGSGGVVEMENGAEISGGSSGGTINEYDGTELQLDFSADATLDNMTITAAGDEGNIDASQDGANLTISGNLNFNGTLSLGTTSMMTVSASGTIGGDGTITAQQTGFATEEGFYSSRIQIATGVTETIGEGTTLAGGVIVDSSDYQGALVNDGTIETSLDQEFGSPGDDPTPQAITFPCQALLTNSGYIFASDFGSVGFTDSGSPPSVDGAAMAISPTESVFGWTGLPMTPGDSYLISKTIDGTHFTPVSSTLPGGNYYVLEGLEPNTKYQFQVEEISPGGATWSYRSDTVETNVNVPSTYASEWTGPVPLGVSTDQSGFYQVSDVHTILEGGGEGGLVSPSDYNSGIIAAGSPEGAFLQAMDGWITTQESYNQVELPYAYDGQETLGVGANQAPCLPGNFGPNNQATANVSAATNTNNAGTGGDPIIYSDGDTQISNTDLASSAFGDGWSITRNWTAQDTFVPDTTFGNGWMNQTSSYLQAVSTSASSPNILLIQSAYDQTLFGYNGSTYSPVAVSNDSLTYNSSDDTYTWLNTSSGAESIYYGFGSGTASDLQGKLKESLDAYGNQTSLTYVDGLLNTVTQTDPAGDTSTFQYEYITSGDNAGKVSLIEQCIQRVGDSSATVRQAAYAYYDGTYSGEDAYGNLGDLKTVTIENGDGNVLGEDYYRYYTPSDLADGANGFVGGLKYSFSTDSFTKLSDAYSDPFLATDAQVAIYADEYYEYDPSRRVTKEVVGSMGASNALGQGTYLYSYYLDPNLSSATEDFNMWATRTTETLPDGNQNIIYTSIDGDESLEIENVSVDPGNPSNVGDNWITGYQYDSFGRLLTTISPSAINLSASILGGATTVSGIETAIEPDADLGLSEGLVYSNQGLINGTTYYSDTTATSTTAGDVTGFVESDYVQNGIDGTKINQDSYSYFAHSDFAGMTVYPVAAYTLYQSDASGGSDPATTTYDYTWQSSSSGVTNQVEQETTNDPVVSTSQNGSGTATSTYTIYSTFGQPVWTMDGNGYITYTAYDNVTGAVIQSIQDVQTSPLSGLANYSGTSFTEGYNELGVPELPSGSSPTWATPSVGGLNLITTNYVDGLGRTIEEISPAGNITLYVYDDIDRATFMLPGVILDTEDGTLTTTGPITMDRTSIPYSYTASEQTFEGLYDEMLTFSVNTPVSYSGGGTGEPVIAEMPNFIRGDSASSGPANVLNLIGDGSSSSPQFTIQSLTRDLYDSSGRTEGQLVESDAYASLTNATYLATAPGDPYSGTSINPSTGSGNYAAAIYAYDVFGRLYQTIDADGTIDDVVYDSMDRLVSEWIGTDDAVSGASGTPSYFVGSNSGTGNNMTEVESCIYDNGGVGDGNLTQDTQYVDSSSSDNRVTLNLYDWRDRLIATKQGALLSSGSPDPSGETDGAHRLISYTTYDNLDEPTAVYTYAGDGVSLTDFATWTSSTDASDLRAYSTESFDSLGQVYLAQTYSVSPTSGTVGASLSTNYFYDNDGNLLEESDPGGIVTKHEYDGAGRDIKDSTTDGSVINGSGLSWSDAADSTDENDVVIEQTFNRYDKDGNLIETEDMQRFDSDPSTATGDLDGPSGGDLSSRNYYMGYYYDAADRLTDSVNVGTNGGSAWTLPSTVPSDSATVLVTQTQYDAAGNPSVVTDPRGIETETIYDMLGDTIETIDAWDGTSSAIPTSDTNQTTTYTYDGDSNELTMTAVMPSGTNSQTTAYVYGTTSTSGVYSNDLLAKIEYPSASTGLASTASTDDQSYTYDKLGDEATFTDQNGTTHTYGYDVLGRLTSDTATTLGSGVSGSTRRLGYSFNDAGLPLKQTSYSNTSGTSVENQVEDVYNGYGQLITQYQADAGSVNTSSTPSVQYGYSQPTGANYSRQTSLTYPDGRVVDYNYNSGIDTTISRLSSMSDSGGNIESYSYLGLSTIVREVRPGSVLTYVKANGASNGDAGDIYTGLDRFGRVIDQLWTTSDTPDGTTGDTLGTITDQFEYGYDQDSNVLYKDNMVHSVDSELYHANSSASGDDSTAYDPLNRLTAFRRGTLSSSGNNGSTLDTVTTASATNSWSLDALGNSTETGSTSRSLNSKNQITSYGGSSTITYDHDGNMTTDQAGNTYEYDAWNRLVFVNLPSQSTNENFTYNAGGERPGLTICNGSTTSSYYSTQWQDLEDDVYTPAQPCVPASTTKSTYLWSEAYIDELVARDTSVNGGSVTRVYAQQDANHDVTSLTNSSGTVLERFVYDPYGARTVLNASWSSTSDSYNWVYGFQGGRLDPLDGLVNFRNRDLNPTTGTWMEQDPDGYVNGPNRYQFVLSSPLSYVDPFGLLVASPGIGSPGVQTWTGGGTTFTGTGGDLGGGTVSSTGAGGSGTLTSSGGTATGATTSSTEATTSTAEATTSTAEAAEEAEAGGGALSSLVDAAPPLAALAGIAYWAHTIDQGVATQYQVEMTQYNHRPSYYYWLQRNATACRDTPTPAANTSTSPGAPAPQSPPTSGSGQQPPITPPVAAPPSPDDPYNILGKTPVTPGPNYPLDQGPHPAVLGRDGNVYVGYFHGSAAESAGGPYNVVASGQVDIGPDGTIEGYDLNPIWP